MVAFGLIAIGLGKFGQCGGQRIGLSKYDSLLVKRSLVTDDPLGMRKLVLQVGGIRHQQPDSAAEATARAMVCCVRNEKRRRLSKHTLNSIYIRLKEGLSSERNTELHDCRVRKHSVRQLKRRSKLTRIAPIGMKIRWHCLSPHWVQLVKHGSN